jgi:hypothetical protein
MYLQWRAFLCRIRQIGVVHSKEYTPVSENFLSEWLDRHIWPQVQTMMLNDAYFKLMGRARELTGEFNGPIAGLIEVGYVTSRTRCDFASTNTPGGQGEKSRSGRSN